MNDLQLYEHIYERLWVRDPRWTFDQISESLDWLNRSGQIMNRKSAQKRYRRLCDKLKKEYRPANYQSKSAKKKLKKAHR